jgi:hypothetical protein
MRIKLLMAMICLTISVQAAERSPDVTEIPPRDTFLLVPLHIHILSCKDRPEIDCKLTDADIARIVGKINGIWHKAGIHFCYDAPLREEAEDVAAFAKRAAKPVGPDGPPLGIYRLLAPAKTRTLPGLHVYYVHQLPPNGVYLGSNICFVKETASLRKVEGGIDEPLPRVSAHELGHGLSLPHRQNITNLMASGTTGTLLNEDEVEKTRHHAMQMEGTMTVEQCQSAIDAATKDEKTERGKALARYLDELPKK